MYLQLPLVNLEGHHRFAFAKPSKLVTEPRMGKVCGNAEVPNFRKYLFQTRHKQL
jgi:hypothetical protein